MNKSARAYEDARVNLDRALESPNGIRVVCKSPGAAVHTRSRYNYYRALNREQNMEVYPLGHSMHGNSPYDNLVLRIDGNTVYIALRDPEEVTVEEIPEKLSTENVK